jgi:hypothetical protein
VDKDLHPSDWDLKGLNEAYHHQFNLRLELKSDEVEGMRPEGLSDIALERFSQFTRTRSAVLARRCCANSKRLS